MRAMKRHNSNNNTANNRTFSAINEVVSSRQHRHYEINTTNSNSTTSSKT